MHAPDADFVASTATFSGIVVVLDYDHLVHVPMSLRARTSALDLWLELKGSGKVY